MTYPDSGIASDHNPYDGYTEDDGSATPQKLTPRKKINKSVGVYAGVLAITLAVYAIAGVIWGLLRPTYTAFVEDAETASIAVESNTSFTGYAWFVIATGVLAAAIALVVFLRSPQSRGPLMLIWLGIVSASGAVAFLIFGSYSSTLLHGSPSDYATAVGESFQVAPAISPGIALAVAPFLAVCMYWCAAFVTPEEALETD
ncbi:hypothetical protein N24_2177 [Corynebacterium suranareeae]|uniref:DUF2567 domain-containing protein n=1 Tax=Corynebacterium suranareeae TaxID=2506452 RepID=A0A160PQX6_9CORY|nr:hypothetical protein [Corynebacterium suranareeae]BAU96439.1 hypothetical protein N24_2177 [Corynebacterium suranareeae]